MLQMRQLPLLQLLPSRTTPCPPHRLLKRRLLLTLVGGLLASPVVQSPGVVCCRIGAADGAA